jgi:hypothetical protein
MTVSEHVTRFMKLSRYALNDVDTNEKKREFFLNGLDDGLPYALEACDFKNFHTMVDKALVLENRRGILTCSASRSVRPNIAPTLSPASMSIVCLLDHSSAPSHRVLNRCLTRLAKDLSPLSSR